MIKVCSICIIMCRYIFPVGRQGLNNGSPISFMCCRYCMGCTCHPFNFIFVFVNMTVLSPVHLYVKLCEAFLMRCYIYVCVKIFVASCLSREKNLCLISGPVSFIHLFFFLKKSICSCITAVSASL